MIYIEKQALILRLKKQSYPKFLKFNVIKENELSEHIYITRSKKLRRVSVKKMSNNKG